MKEINISQYSDLIVGHHYKIHLFANTDVAKRIIDDFDLLNIISRKESVILTLGDYQNRFHSECSVEFFLFFYQKILERLGSGYLACLKFDQEIPKEVEKFCKTAVKNSKPEWSDNVRLIIPEIGTEIKLTDGWHFTLYVEYRNKYLFKELFKKDLGYRDQFEFNNQTYNQVTVMVNKDATLKVDRIYIRKGSGDYSSVTFFLQKGSTVYSLGETITLKKDVRFWCKLGDVNNIKCQFNLLTVKDQS
jgi:hypothetical protein